MTKKVLLVDDEEGIRKILGLALMDAGYDVVAAGNGEEALEIFRDKQPPIVLTDIKMPGMDGIQVLRAIKAENPDTEVIMITGHGDMDLAIQSLKFEATDFITKPISTDALEIALKRARERIYYRNKLREYTENLEKLVTEKTKKLLEAERMAAVGETVAGLAHAIKNVTAGLTGGAFVLEKGMELDDKKYLTQGWEMVKGNIERIKRMALDLLNFARDQGLDLELCDPNKPLKETYDLMLPRAQGYGIRLVLEMDKDLPKTWLDPEGIHRCMVNLVTNAIDACIDIGASSEMDKKVILRSSRPKDYAVEYQVTDNGCGMTEETKAKVFQQFFTTKGSQGTGLGLMITKKIVDEHGGVIELQSSEKRGTTFTIKLPEIEQSTDRKEAIESFEEARSKARFS
ncbi:MAG: response regulator [Deltaproteobacteria bacterium]|nr:response regulator [Deltaproteobacteria bacterium]MBW2137071.1 response regulator [Deltaproteobacteria bacterium]